MRQGRTLRRTTAAYRVRQQSGEQFQDNRPFASRNFREGDLVYGVEKSSGPLAWDRNHYVRQVFNARHLPCKISDFRVLLEEQNQPLNKRKVPEEKSGDFLSQEKNFIETLTKHDKYKTAVNGGEFDNSAVRRKSKGGLYWATKEAKKHVHFVLDGLDIKSVVTKSFAGENGDHPIGSSESLGSGEVKNRSVTGSELRWIYRNREDSDVQRYVHFWFEGKPCRPPWEEYKTTRFQNGKLETIEHNVETLWSQYVPKGKGVMETTSID
ncbi:hypothetical protein ACFQUU_19445 [Herbaspirillum sp. GCM10030257]|uniref:hypothetical protein n=1 Tax=Herbaspirillum sp. GCM10030257 TaxID=3273393 RepID=UPI00361F6FD3